MNQRRNLWFVWLVFQFLWPIGYWHTHIELLSRVLPLFYQKR